MVKYLRFDETGHAKNGKRYIKGVHRFIDSADFEYFKQYGVEVADLTGTPLGAASEMPIETTETPVEPLKHDLDGNSKLSTKERITALESEGIVVDHDAHWKTIQKMYDEHFINEG